MISTPNGMEVVSSSIGMEKISGSNTAKSRNIMLSLQCHSKMIFPEEVTAHEVSFQ